MNVDYLKYCPTCAWCCSDEKLFLSDEERSILGTDGFSSQKSSSGKCEKLNDDNLCSVHPKRPIECRIFPLDIQVDQNGEFFWILWTGHCPAARSVDVSLFEKDMLSWESQLTEDWVRAYTSHHLVNQPQKYDKLSSTYLRKFVFGNI